MPSKQPPGPPTPPALPRSIVFERVQKLGVPALLVLPVVALAIAGGLARTEARSARGGLELTVEHPRLVMFGAPEQLRISVANTGHEPVARVRVEVPQGYLDAFAGVQFTPEAVEPGATELGPLWPGETRTVR